jgi:hypothetical protein
MRTFTGRVLAVLALLTLATPAAAQDVKVDFDDKFNFSNVKTFSVRIASPWGNQLSESRVLAEFEEALAAKGWRKADEAAADANVLLHGATSTQKSLNTFYSGMGGYRWGGMGSATTTVSQYTVGTLVADIFDAKTKHLIFRGTAEGELSDNPEKNKKKLEKVTSKMFKNFPPGSATR